VTVLTQLNDDIAHGFPVVVVSRNKPKV